LENPRDAYTPLFINGILDQNKLEEYQCSIRARKAVGLFRNLEDAVEDMVTIKERLEPNPKNTKAYDKPYAKYIKLYESLIELFAINCRAHV
jgi:sugar (pentulose or hexulose) kinase